MATLSPAADAKLTVGSGAGAFSVTSASNTVTGLMPGVSLQLNSADPSTPVTVALAPDASALASQVSTLVSAANAMLGDLNLAQTLPSSTSTSSSSSSSTSSAAGNALQGILLGDPTANSLVTSLLNAVSSEAGSNGTGSAGLVGITLNTNGTLAFDQSTFEAAYTANPTKVANTFTQGSTSTSSLMSMYEATDGTQGGTYAVNVTQAATQASVTGATVSGGAVSTAETLTLAANSSTATYQTTAGESLTDIAAGINAATASAGVGVEASVNNNALTLSSVAYGHGGTFSVTSSAAGAGTTGLASTAGTAQTYTGQDVAGTINGTAATGNGQLLLGALGTPEVGLLVQVTATQAQVSAAGGSLGSVSYTPGIAAALASAADHAVAPGTGSVVNAISGLQSESTDLNTQITAWNPILQAQQVMLEQEYNNMETALASLDSTKTSLTQDAASLSAGLG
jgi:flagellar hook-associated protein 2